MFKYEVAKRLENQPFLIPIFSDVHDISRRIREVDPTLFICFNTVHNRYEVHCLEHYPDTAAWIVSFRELDRRTILRARKNNVLARGDLIFREVDRRNATLKESMRRQRSNDLDALARETRSMFKPLAWEL